MIHTSFAMTTLVPVRARAELRCCAIAAVHALRKTQSSLAELPHVAVRTLAHFFVVAPSIVCALFIAFWIWY